MNYQVYILQKDLPDGAVKGDKYNKIGDRYFNQRLDSLKSPVIEHNSYFTWQVENNPEWFKKEEPKEWEILEFIIDFLGSKDVHFTIGRDGIYRTGLNGQTFEYVIGRLLAEKAKIHSVKRLSGVHKSTFTIGDVDQFGKITSFYIVGNDMMVEHDGYGGTQYLTNCVLKENLKPKEEPIPIKVTDIDYINIIGLKNIGGGRTYTFGCSEIIPTEKYEPIKKAIESVLRGNEDMGNIETFNRGYSMGRYDASKYDQKQHTSEELLQARKEALEAARVRYQITSCGKLGQH